MRRVGVSAVRVGVSTVRVGVSTVRAGEQNIARTGELNKSEEEDIKFELP
jgi:hypothetical protein